MAARRPEGSMGPKEQTRLRSWQPTAKQVAAELAEVPWRMGCRDAAAQAKERRKKETGKLEESMPGSGRQIARSKKVFAFIFGAGGAHL